MPLAEERYFTAIFVSSRRCSVFSLTESVRYNGLQDPHQLAWWVNQTQGQPDPSTEEDPRSLAGRVNETPGFGKPVIFLPHQKSLVFQPQTDADRFTLDGMHPDSADFGLSLDSPPGLPSP
jgi:hypothetical protein